MKNFYYTILIKISMKILHESIVIKQSTYVEMHNFTFNLSISNFNNHLQL